MKVGLKGVKIIWVCLRDEKLLSSLSVCFLVITKNRPIQIYRKFHLQKPKFFREKILIFFIFLLKNIDCGYTLELPAEAVLTSTHNLCF